MASQKNEKVQPSNAKNHASKPKDKKAGKSSATLDRYIYDTTSSVQERMAYQPVDKQYRKDNKASKKAEAERLEKIINKV
ncbi:hypothetical protein VF21_01083 [Pseudogymnoascus sp. 05NY08]|nr:hypothetical protein VF21_01083 [Pseudogymnoascus sp. 05NY08]